MSQYDDQWNSGSYQQGAGYDDGSNGATDAGGENYAMEEQQQEG